MTNLPFDKEVTVLPVIDPHNDFISEGGKIWGRFKAVAEAIHEVGYEVTMPKAPTADYSHEEMHAALDINIPNYASAVVATDQVVASISSP